MTVEPWQTALIEMAANIKEMKADGKVDSAKLQEWHEDETRLLTDIKGGVNGVGSYLLKILTGTVAALIVLAGAAQALKFFG